MSLISKQVDELRTYANGRKGELAKLISDAADTIELLSAKLSALNIERRSSQYYHEGWIPCSKKLPDEKDAGVLKKLGIEKHSEYVFATVEVKGERMAVTACTYDGKWDWNMKYAFPDYEIVAWMPFPEPYKGEKTNGEVFKDNNS